MIEKVTQEAVWNKHVQDKAGHPLQLWGWGEVKAHGNWTPERLLVSVDGEVIGGAQVLIRRLPPPFYGLAYIPRGPFGDTAAVLEVIAEFYKQHKKIVAISTEPDISQLLLPSPWRQVAKGVLIPETLVLDLTKTEEELLKEMAKKTRQYIRKSAQSGVEVRLVTQKQEIERCLTVYKQTAKRANFALHGDEYYYHIASLLGEASRIYGAYYNNVLVAFVWLVTTQEVAFELYGGVTDEGQQLRANYTLKWQAVTDCKQRGVKCYDMNGLLNDGISTFKRSFASHETQLAGTYDYPLSPMYTAWTKGLPLIKRVVRAVKPRS